MAALLLLLLLAQSSSFDSTFRAGLQALQQNDLTEARTQLESAAKMEPGRAQVWLALAQTYLKLHDAGLARPAALKAERLAPRDPVILHGLGLFYSESGDYEKAADCESAYAALAPGNAGAYPRAIQLYLRARKPRSAIEAARKALAGENRAEVHQLLGKAYEMDGQPAEAVREMREAIRLNPYDESCYFDLSRDLLGSNRPQDAIQLLEDGKKIFASSAQLELALGVAYYAMRRFPDTVAAFLRTIQIDPRAEQPYIFLGRMLEQTEDKLPLVTAAFAALAKDEPENYLASFLYGKALLQSGQREQAEVLLLKSMAVNSQFWESHFELGVVLEHKHDFTGAQLEFARATGLNPKNPTVHYRLARILDRLGKTTEAKAEHALHESLTREENAFIRRQVGGLDSLGLPVE